MIMTKNEDFFHPVSTDLMTWILDDEPVGRTVTIQTEENTIIGVIGGYLEIGSIIFLQIFNKKMNEMTFVNTKNIMSFTVY